MQSEAVRELVAKGERLLKSADNSTCSSSACDAFRASLAVVKEEGKPQTHPDCPKCGHEWRRHSEYLRRCVASLGLDAAGDSEECDCTERPPDAPILQTEGK